MAHPELGARVLDNVAGQINDIGKIEAQARMDGRNMTMVLAPDKKPLPRKSAAERNGDEPAEEPAATDQA